MFGVTQPASSAVSTGVDQDVKGGRILERVVGPQDEVLRGHDIGPAG